MIARDGFPIGMSPLGWAKVCKHGDTYGYEYRGMVPVGEAELDALIDACGERGLSLSGDDRGLRVENIED
jgi:hypothetical protein